MRTLSRRIRLKRCTSTVRTLIASRFAMSRLVFPWETRRRISFCRGVSPPVLVLEGLEGLMTLGRLRGATTFLYHYLLNAVMVSHLDNSVKESY